MIIEKSQNSNETFEFCPKKFCIKNYSIILQSAKKVLYSIKLENDLVLPGLQFNDKFEPFYFEFHSRDEELITYKILCKTFENLNWTDMNPFPYYSTFKFFNLSPEYIKIFHCSNHEWNYLSDCSFKYKTYRYSDHRVFGINCANRKIMKNKMFVNSK